MRESRKKPRRPAKAIQEEIASIGEEVSSLGEKLGQDASEETRAAINSIREGLDRILEDAGDLTRAGALELRDTIREYPFTGVAVGVGIGFVLAGILRRL